MRPARAPAARLMSRVIERPLPGDGHLSRYANGAGRDHGHYTDCFSADIDGDVTLPQYVEAFLTTPLFRLERMLLATFARRPSSDEQAAGLAAGRTDLFAAWSVERRDADQLLLRDVTGRTRTWFMVDRPVGDDGRRTRLYFGSAVVRLRDRGALAAGGPGWRLLIRLHRVYSTALLRAALRRIRGQRDGR